MLWIAKFLWVVRAANAALTCAYRNESSASVFGFLGKFIEEITAGGWSADQCARRPFAFESSTKMGSLLLNALYPALKAEDLRLA
jgi:hypothetical protein